MEAAHHRRPFCATNAHNQRLSFLVRELVSSPLSTGCWGNASSSSWQGSATAARASSQAFCVVPRLRGIPKTCSKALQGSARNMANHGHIGQGGRQAWPEVAPHFRRYRRLGGLPAARADHVGHLIFGDVGLDLRQFPNLMPPGFSFGHPGGCILGQGLVTGAALLGKHRHYPVDPLKRNQGPPVPRMPFLSSRFASLFSFPLPTAPRPLWSRQSVTGRRFMLSLFHQARVIHQPSFHRTSLLHRC